ncbi:histidine phosphatase family protein [Nonomuraea sp. M3C6]|uniref:Histidine phosphatase family protein n=1 Tax=Nonomuraea marmarensis TaxID=3351344 RepID=A0ABW7ALR1_9ACTN
MTRYLYLTRHGEASPDGSLTDAGRRQATLLGERLQGISFAAVHHGPLPRVTQTAELIGEQLPGIPLARPQPLQRRPDRHQVRPGPPVLGALLQRHGAPAA